MVVEGCITGIGECDKIKGFQVHLFAFGAPIPVFLHYVLQSRVYSTFSLC